MLGGLRICVTTTASTTAERARPYLYTTTGKAGHSGLHCSARINTRGRRYGMTSLFATRQEKKAALTRHLRRAPSPTGVYIEACLVRMFSNVFDLGAPARNEAGHA